MWFERLTPMDARTLQWFLEYCAYPQKGAFADKHQFTGDLHQEFSEDGIASFEHLLSLGVFEIEMWIGQQSGYSPWRSYGTDASLKEALDILPEQLQIEQQLGLSTRGMSLVRSCSTSLDATIQG